MKEIDWQMLANLPGSKNIGEKKFMILDSAIRIISQEGIQGLSVTKIAQKSRISKSLILYHYKTINQIIEDLFFFSGKMIRYFIEKNVKDDQSFEEKIIAMIKSLFEWLKKNKEVGEFFILMYHEANKTSGMQEILRSILKISDEMWQKIFLESMRYNGLKEVQMLILGIHSMIVGTLIRMIATNDEDNYLYYQDILIFNLEKILNVKLQRFEI